MKNYKEKQRKKCVALRRKFKKDYLFMTST